MENLCQPSPLTPMLCCHARTWCRWSNWNKDESLDRWWFHLHRITESENHRMLSVGRDL